MEPLTAYSPLSRSRRIAARKAARDYWVDDPIRVVLASDKTRAAAIRERLRGSPEFGSILGSILVALAVRLAVELVKYWIDRKIINPTATFEPGEPGQQ